MKIAVHPSYGTTGFGIGYDEQQIFSITGCCHAQVGFQDHDQYYCPSCGTTCVTPKEWPTSREWLPNIDFYMSTATSYRKFRFEGEELTGWICGWLGIERDQIVNIDLKETP